MDILSKLSERLKELLDEEGINVADLGRRIKLEPSVISKFLRAERLPSATTLVKIADFFQVTADYLLGLTDFLDVCEFKVRPPFCERLNFLLRTFKVTKYRLEKEARFAELTVNRWQKGICEPSADSLVRLAEYFNCSVDYILGRED